MARDYTKYNVEGLGENLNKRQLVYTVVKDWANKNNPSFDAIQKAFPDEVQGSKGFICKESEVKDPKRFNMREPIKIKNGALVVVSNQWGDNIKSFLATTTKLGYMFSIIENEVGYNKDADKKNSSLQNKKTEPELLALSDWGDQYFIQTKNYKGLHFNNGDLIQKAETMEEFLKIGEDAKPCLIHLQEIDEMFYNFYAISDPRGFAPDGYRIPSSSDWDSVFSCLNIKTAEEEGFGENESIEQNYLLNNNDRFDVEDTIKYYEKGNLKNNFNAIPSGFVNYDGHFGYEKHAMYWTSDDFGYNECAWVALNSNYIYIAPCGEDSWHNMNNATGMTVRLIKDTTL